LSAGRSCFRFLMNPNIHVVYIYNK
jgi:hypothetical protein